MKRCLAFLVANLVAAGAMAIIFPPNVQRSMLVASIGASPLVTVGDVVEEGDGYFVNVTSPDPQVAQGLAFILIKEYDFGGLHLTVRVLDGDGNEVVVPDTPATDDPVGESQQYVLAALADNPLFARISDLDAPYTWSYFVELRPTVVRYFSGNIGNPYGVTSWAAEEAFRSVCRDSFFSTVQPYWTTASTDSSFGDEGILPAVAHSSGYFGSLWTTDVWLVGAGATSVDLWFYRQDRDNSDAAKVTVPLSAPVTRITDVVATLFGTTGTGALRYEADGPVRVIGRTSSPSPGGGTSGVSTSGVPLTKAAKGGILGRTLSMVVDQRPGFRADLGLINVQPAAAQVLVTVIDAAGDQVPGFEPLTVSLPPFGVKQINDLLGGLPDEEHAGLVVQARLVGEQGALIAYLSDVDNTSNDPTYQEPY